MSVLQQLRASAARRFKKTKGMSSTPQGRAAEGAVKQLEALIAPLATYHLTETVKFLEKTIKLAKKEISERVYGG